MTNVLPSHPGHNIVVIHEQPSPFPIANPGLEHEEIIDELCQCGALRSDHMDTFSYGHGPCPRSGCVKFRWAEFVVGPAEDRVREAIDDMFYDGAKLAELIVAVRGLLDGVHRNPAVHGSKGLEKLCSRLHDELTKAMATADEFEHAFNVAMDEEAG